MAKMLGRAMWWGFCACWDCGDASHRKSKATYKRRLRRRELNQWRREVAA
jgi:hypothetical protein